MDESESARGKGGSREEGGEKEGRMDGGGRGGERKGMKKDRHVEKLLPGVVFLLLLLFPSPHSPLVNTSSPRHWHPPPPPPPPITRAWTPGGGGGD